ncbi:MAG: hypothetical protein A3F17_03350 [Gammaproteobacteria bacterium RIFCSPHIGHO2_12_FULL_41_15]|nr:MAG: hypothetical protein A3F17_03350 [Gammaproteobacteria bacterium RIFCSPHIGHO2_12_FULL_41_15]
MDQQHLQAYASVTKSKILESQSDLDPKDHALSAMLTWCREQGCIVVLQSGNILCSDPTSRVIQNCKAAMLNKGLKPKSIFAATDALIHILLENAEVEQNPNEKSITNVSTQQQRLRMLVKEALELNATDIHLEVREDIARIRLRRHGELVLHAEWLPKLAREITSVAFNKETDHATRHFNALIPQNASMPLIIGEQKIRLRLASLPAHQGYDVVMRILTSSKNKVQDLQTLGYFPEQIRLIQKAISMPSGAIIVAGPTGAGKTTTLASCMQTISSERKVYSIEDPVEQVVENISQIPVNTDHYDRTFASMTRTALRMDPDIIVLGEMRDEDTASIMMRAAITGHLVFSTIHTNSAMDIITRLTDLGVSRALLASPHLLVCLICQRLIPLLCQQCAIPIEQSALHRTAITRWRHTFADIKKLQARGEHCAHCHHQGIKGRTVAAEIIWLDVKGREYILQGDYLQWKQHLKHHGWKSYQERLIQMAAQGEVDPLDVEKLIGEIHPFEENSFNYRATESR